MNAQTTMIWKLVFLLCIFVLPSQTVGVGGYKQIEDLSDSQLKKSAQIALENIFANDLSEDSSVNLVSIGYGLQQVVNGTNYFLCLVFKSANHMGTFAHLKFWVSLDLKEVEIHEFEIPQVEFLYERNADETKYPILKDVHTAIETKCNNKCKVTSKVIQYQTSNKDLKEFGRSESIQMDYASVSFETNKSDEIQYYGVLTSEENSMIFNVKHPEQIPSDLDDKVTNFNEPSEIVIDIPDGTQNVNNDDQSKSKKKKKYINENVDGGTFLTIIVSALLGAGLTYAIIFFFWKKNKRLPCTRLSKKADKEKLFDMREMRSHEEA
mmetsp:Transcript_15595/g.17322  ORF Transcript_15595/g.17322 Transcript_15595/m.17322 type:complete len:323 (+) Transcript_15595:23-991(+)